jgi:NADPH:quinone reductase-like Zn-dependent oxidoreductase
LRARPQEEKIRILEAFLERFGQALAEGRLAPTVYAVLPIAEVERAHALMRANENIGKIVLQVREGAERAV